MDYPLENLGPERFQQLCQALLVAESPGITCYPVGMPDGGRDAIRRSTAEPNEDFVVFQVKFSRSAPVDGRNWILSAATGEIEKVNRLKARGATRYVLITNVSGTSHLENGSMDKLQGELTKALDIPVQCWWRDDINRRLDANWNLKLRYPEVLSGQDFLRLLISNKDDTQHQRRVNALKSFMADQFIEDQDVKFKQVELQNKLLDLFVDLPFSIEFPESVEPAKQRDILMRTDEIESDEQIERRRFMHASKNEGTRTATFILGQSGNDFTNQIVVEGAPGQGKSTLAQYLCQVHRIRFLNKNDDLLALPQSHRNSPVCIPIKVDLRDLSEWLSGVNPFAIPEEKNIKETQNRSVESFLARLIQHKAGGIAFDVNDVLEVSKLMPLFIAFDGLDEVADIKRRTEVVSSITKSLNRLRESCLGLQAIITSRPAAFANSPGFDRKIFPYIQLGSVQREQIVSYSNKWMDARGLSISERSEFMQVLNEKLDQPHLRDLSRNPMQLTILLSLIHTKGAALPDKRTSLYDSYVDLFFSRESTKNSVVRQHLELLKDLHRYLAWVLHSRTESARGAGTDGRFTSLELKAVLNTYLLKEGRSTAIIEEVFNAMLERVVMIVSRIEGTHEFEVQPLREYFAARFLYDTAPYSPPGKESSGTKPDRFDAISRNHYWLNVARFFSGCFSKGELLDLADRIRTLIQDPQAGKTRHPILLSAMLLSDSVFSQSSRASNELIEVISTRQGLRNLIPASIRGRNEESARLPDANGKLLKAAYEYMSDKSTRADLRSSLGRLILANSSEDKILPIWWEKIPEADTDFEHWLSIGYALDILEKVSSKSLSEVLQGRKLTRNSIIILWQAGKGYSISASEYNSQLLENYVLSAGNYWISPSAVGAPFFLIPIFHQIISSEHFFSGLSDVTMMVTDALENFKSIDPGSIIFATGFLDSFSKKCYEASNAVATRFAVNESEVDPIDFWKMVINCCEEVFGHCEMVTAMAMSIPSKKRRELDPLERVAFFDTSEPAFDRVRFAKSNARSWKYWKDTLAFANSIQDRLLVYKVLLIHAPVSMLVEHAEELSADIDAFQNEDWDMLLSLLRTMKPLGMHGPIPAKTKSIKRKLRSQRLSFVIAFREPASSRDIFLQHYRINKRHHQLISQFRQTMAMLCALEGDLDWKGALEIIKYSYGDSIYFSIASNAKLPMEVVEEVLRNHSSYPGILWERAQEIYSAQVTKQVKTVASIARRDKWFKDMLAT